MSWSAHLPVVPDRAAARRRRADAAARRAPPAAQGGDQPGRARSCCSPRRSRCCALADRPLAPVYALGNWPAPFGIVLVADRLAAAMVLLSGLLGLAATVFSLARWQRAGPRFHALLQFLLMGLNGAFLTGDLFNLFVFFELLLAASYGLALHGSGTARVRSSLHYIVINLAASLLFLIGVSLIYGVTGTLNMAHLAQRIPLVAAEDRVLVEAGAAVLAIAFLVKSGMWPLGFWLPSTYAAASAPAAALFSILTKVGVYAVLRLWLLLFGGGVGAELLYLGGMATLAFGAIGMLASQELGRLAGYSLLRVVGNAARGDQPRRRRGDRRRAVLPGGLDARHRRLLPADRAGAARARARRRRARGDRGGVRPRRRGRGAGRAARHRDPGRHGAARPELPVLRADRRRPAAAAGLRREVRAAGRGARPAAGQRAGVGADRAAHAVRAGRRHRHGPRRRAASSGPSEERSTPRVRVIEIAPVAVLLALCFALTLAAGPVMRYLQDAALALHAPQTYIESVLSRP